MSRTIGDHPAVQAYLDRVCGEIKARDVHADIRMEMLDHLEQLADDGMKEEGLSEEEAVAKAVERMGDPKQIGKGLHAAHRPKPEWSVIALVVCLIGVAIVSLLSLQIAMGDRIGIMPRLLYGSIGIAAMVALYFADYRKLRRFSWPLYGATIALLAATQLTGLTVNGSKQWLQLPLNIYLNVYDISPYLLMIAFAGMLQADPGKEKQPLQIKVNRLLRDAAVYVAIPFYFYLKAPSLGIFATYMLGLVVLLLIKRNWKLLATVCGGAAALAGGMLLPGMYPHYLWQGIVFRVEGFLRLNTDSSYQVQRALEAIQNGGMWGQGFGAASTRLPLAAGEMLYAYMTYSLGWLFSAAVAAIVLFFVIRSIRMGMRHHDSYAKGLILGVTIVLTVRFGWNILMCVGLMPIIGLPLPLVHWYSNTIIEMAAVGLILGAYRRKDIISRSASLGKPAL